MIEGKKIFITGGAGFIGSTLIGRLIEDNQIIVYDNMSRNSLKDKSYAQHANLTMIEGDILDPEKLARSMQGSDIIVHCAAIAGIDTVIASPTKTMQVNMVGSANVLEAASKLSRCDRVVCFSTSEVFGQQAFRATEGDRTVTGAVGEARWTYAVSKLAEEHLAVAYYKEKWLPTTVVRPFTVYGPGQVGDGAIHVFVKRAIRNLPIQVHGDGSQIRAWCYIDDMVDGLLLCMSHPEAVGESFNIGNERDVITIYGLANTVVRVLKSQSEIAFVPKPWVDVELRIPVVEKARRLLNYSAKVDLEEGIRRAAAFYVDQMEAETLEQSTV